MVWVNPNEPFPDEPTRRALSDRSYAHIPHVEEEGEAATEQDDQERARNGLLYTMERFRRLATPAQVEEGEGEEGEEEEPYEHELDLWLLESQVPGCTRERAERAYEQGQEDVTRALPLARMATLLGDREAMVNFLTEQMPGSTLWEASFAFDEEREDVVEAVIALHRRTQQRLNQPVLSSRSKQRLRIRTVFMLALLYRERYGQLERSAEEAFAQVPLRGRHGREGRVPSFVAPDGSQWTHTREEGWERLRRQQLQQAHANLDDAMRRGMSRGLSEDAARNYADIIAERQRTASSVRVPRVDRSPSPHSPLPEPVLRRSGEQATLVERPHGVLQFVGRGLPDPELWHDSDAPDEDLDEEHPPTLTAASSSSAEEDDDYDDYYDDDDYDDDDEGNERPTAGAYARPRPFVRSAGSAAAQDRLRAAAKRNLRIIQEQLDAEMANANQGIVMGEGAYVAMMNAVKGIWESVDLQPTG